MECAAFVLHHDRFCHHLGVGIFTGDEVLAKAPVKCMYGRILRLHTKSNTVAVTLHVRWSSLSWKSNRPKVRIILEYKEVLKDQGMVRVGFIFAILHHGISTVTCLLIFKMCITQRYEGNRQNSRVLRLRKKLSSFVTLNEDALNGVWPKFGNRQVNMERWINKRNRRHQTTKNIKFTYSQQGGLTGMFRNTG